MFYSTVALMNQNYHCVFDNKTPVPKKCLKLAKTIHMTSFVTIATVQNVNTPFGIKMLRGRISSEISFL